MANPSGDYYKERQRRFFGSCDESSEYTSGEEVHGKIKLGANSKKPPILKRCRMKGVENLITTKASQIAICNGSVHKLYLGKYYRQRLVFQSPGEPWVLQNFQSPFFVEAHKFHCNPLRTVDFLEQEKILGECGESIEMERLNWRASDSEKVKRLGLVKTLTEWLEGLRVDLRRLQVQHRDISLDHIMFSEKKRKFRLIDFAVAIPDDWKLAPEEQPSSFDDNKKIDSLLETVKGWVD